MILMILCLLALFGNLFWPRKRFVKIAGLILLSFSGLLWSSTFGGTNTLFRAKNRAELLLHYGENINREEFVKWVSTGFAEAQSFTLEVWFTLSLGFVFAVIPHDALSRRSTEPAAGDLPADKQPVSSK